MATGPLAPRAAAAAAGPAGEAGEQPSAAAAAAAAAAGVDAAALGEAVAEQLGGAHKKFVGHVSLMYRELLKAMRAEMAAHVGAEGPGAVGAKSGSRLQNAGL